MTEILYLHDESVVRESHEHDIINSSQSVFIKESIVSFSPKLSFKKIFYQYCPLLFGTLEEIENILAF